MAAYAEAGRLDDAAHTISKLLPLASEERQPELRERLKLYRSSLAGTAFSSSTPFDSDILPQTADRDLGTFSERGLAAATGWSVLADMAWILATHDDPRVRNGATAVRLGKDAVARCGELRPDGLIALAAAQAESNRFDEVDAAFARSLRVPCDDSIPGMLSPTDDHRRQYAQRLPVRWTPPLAFEPPDENLTEDSFAARRLAYLHVLLSERQAVRLHPLAAVAALRDAVAIDGGYPAARHGLGFALYHAGDLLGACVHLSEALRRKPDDSEGQSTLAAAMYRQGWIKPAAMCWRRALDLQPESAEVANNLAWVYATASDEADRDAKEAVHWAEMASRSVNDTSPDYLDTLAAAYAEAGRFEDAVARTRASIKLRRAAGKLTRSQEDRLKSYLAERPWRDNPAATVSTEISEDAKAKGKSRQEGATLLADQLLKTEQQGFEEPLWFEAVRATALVLATHEDARVRDGRVAQRLMDHVQRREAKETPQTLRVLAACAAENEQFPEAVTLARRAIGLARAKLDAALADRLEDELDGYTSRKPLRMSAKRAPDDGPPSPGKELARRAAIQHYVLATALGDLGSKEGFIHTCRRAVDFDGGLRQAHVELGQALLRDNQPKEAARHLQAALWIKFEDADTLITLGAAWLQLDKPLDGITCWREALVQRPDWPEAANNLAWVLATHADDKIRNPQEAVELARRACRNGKGSAEFVATLATALYAAGQAEEAAVEFRRGIDLARATGNAELVKRLTQRLENLPQK